MTMTMLVDGDDDNDHDDADDDDDDDEMMTCGSQIARFDEPWQGNGWHERRLLACAISWGS